MKLTIEQQRAAHEAAKDLNIDPSDTAAFRLFWKSTAAYVNSLGYPMFTMPNGGVGEYWPTLKLWWAWTEPKPKCREEELAEWLHSVVGAHQTKEAAAVLRKVAAVRKSLEGEKPIQLAQECEQEGLPISGVVLRAVADLMDSR